MTVVIHHTPLPPHPDARMAVVYYDESPDSKATLREVVTPDPTEAETRPVKAIWGPSSRPALPHPGLDHRPGHRRGIPHPVRHPHRGRGPRGHHLLAPGGTAPWLPHPSVMLAISA